MLPAEAANQVPSEHHSCLPAIPLQPIRRWSSTAFLSFDPQSAPIFSEGESQPYRIAT